MIAESLDGAVRVEVPGGPAWEERMAEWVRMFRACGPDVYQLAALAALEARPMVVGDLSRAMGRHPAAMTDIVDGLERRGWATRTCGTDRRVRIVALTDPGRAELGRWRARVEEGGAA